MSKRGNFELLLCFLLLLWKFQYGDCQEPQGLNPVGVNVCSRTQRITQYMLMQPLSSPLTPSPAAESSDSDMEGEEPADIALRPRSRVGVRTSTIIVYECCAGWRRGNGTSCEIAICRDCNNGQCVSPNRCVCEAGWTGSSCSEPCLPYSTRSDCACPPGYTGPGCSQPCLAGTFGENCRTTCACIDGECDPTNGVCNNNYIQGATLPPLIVTEVHWPMNDKTPTQRTHTAMVFPEMRYPLKNSGMKITISILCGILILVIALMISLLLCGRWKQRASLYRKQSCKRAILPRQTPDGEIEESIQMPERSITSASMITQPNSYMYMSFTDQESITRSERSATIVGHDLTSLINGYATYTSTAAGTPAPEEPIYEVKLSNSDEEKMFVPRESAGSNYTDADDVLSGPRIVPGKETSDTEECPLPDEEYEYPYVDCKTPPETAATQGCGSPSCPISSSHELTTSLTSQQDGHSAVAAFHPRRESSVSSSEDYCQADAIPSVKLTEVPIDGTYTALIRHPEPEYSTTVTFSSPARGSSPQDLSNIVGYVTSVSAVSFKHPPRPAVRRNTHEQTTNQRRPPSASRLKLHQFRDVIEPEIQTTVPKQGSYVNDRVPSPPGKEKIKRPVPAPRARLLPAHLMENVEDMVL